LAREAHGDLFAGVGPTQTGTGVSRWRTVVVEG